jgi:hypothetical protein
VLEGSVYAPSEADGYGAQLDRRGVGSLWRTKGIVGTSGDLRRPIMLCTTVRGLSNCELMAGPRFMRFHTGFDGEPRHGLSNIHAEAPINHQEGARIDVSTG